MKGDDWGASLIEDNYSDYINDEGRRFFPVEGGDVYSVKATTREVSGIRPAITDIFVEKGQKRILSYDTDSDNYPLVFGRFSVLK